MIQFWNRYQEKIIQSSIEHIELVVLAILIAFLICIPLYFLSRKYKMMYMIINVVVNAIYTIPSLALFALCVPIIGIGRPAALLTLILYNLFIIFKNTYVGFSTISPMLIEAARGIGYSSMQSFFKIEFPQALPSIFAGLKLASTMTVGLATIASTVNGGGLGTLLFDGLKRRYIGEVLWATFISVALSLIFNGIFQRLENVTLAKAQGAWKVKTND